MPDISVGKILMAVGFFAASMLTATLSATPAAADIPNRDVVDASTAPSVANKAVTASCDPGQQIIGTGAWVAGGGGDVRITEMRPGVNSQGIYYLYVAAAVDEDGTSNTWSLHASAICAAPLPGLEIVPATSTPASDPANPSISARCTGARKLLGAGYKINDGFGQVGIDDFRVFSGSVAAVAREDDTGFATSWSVTAYAICADPLPGLQIVERIGAFQSDYVNTVNARCPDGQKITGGGGMIEGGLGQVILEDLTNESDRYTVTAFEDDNGWSSTWRVYAYAICADD
jgi:hypothetical protein